ncbi:hypothetical protein [Pedobacter cryoconitis]|uniref:Lipoprotein n=1 Tax=Pedobacter cryoconitis TaxID=188932 RepID=A0A327SZ53_9SPHI|nr:hypothetical protein [Pedobacter cryoconitis]RAJ34281.1 hypothetical protein LY11_01173 [Pedobacter cryoconitis]
MNKFVYFIWLLLLVSAGCNQQSGSEKNGSAVTMKKGLQEQNEDSIAAKRILMIAELQRMQQAFIAKDVNQIEKYFDFPLADSSMSMFDVNEEFDQVRKTNGGMISRELFIKNFNDIYDYFQMGGFNDLFKAVNVAELKTNPKLESESHVEDEGCYSFYIIQIDGDTVSLQYGTNSDPKYREAHPDQEEVCGESAQQWTFKLEGNRLRFIKEVTAG